MTAVNAPESGAEPTAGVATATIDFRGPSSSAISLMAFNAATPKDAEAS